jgi:putative flippase GtrA
MRQFVYFMLAGGVAALANIGTRILFNRVAPFEISVILAYCVGVAVAYTLNRWFVFQSASPKTVTQIGRFLIVNLVALAQVYGVSVLLARVLFPGVGFSFYPDTIAHVAGVLSPVITSYLLHKNYTFAK